MSIHEDEKRGESESKPPAEASGSPVLSGLEVRAATPVPVGRYAGPQAEIGLFFIIVNAVWAWITGIRMRLKIEKDLGRKATDADLSSIDTWMKVEDAESQDKRNRP